MNLATFLDLLSNIEIVYKAVSFIPCLLYVYTVLAKVLLDYLIFFAYI
jgi:hypothetical protein